MPDLRPHGAPHVLVLQGAEGSERRGCLAGGPSPPPPLGSAPGRARAPAPQAPSPRRGLCPPRGLGPSLGTQQPPGQSLQAPGAHLQNSLALVLAGAAEGREGGMWGPLQGRKAAPLTPFPAQPGTSPQGLLRPALEVGAAPCHTSPRSPVTHAWSWGCSGAGVRLGWQLSCSHRSHYSSQSCHLLTLLSGASRQLRSAPSPAFINARSRQAGAAAGGSGGASSAAGPRSPTARPGALLPSSTMHGLRAVPVPAPSPRGSGSAGPQHSPLLLEAERDVLVVAEVVGTGVVEGAVGEPHGVAPNCVWGEGGGGQLAPGARAPHAASSWQRRALAPCPPGAPRPCAHPRRWAVSPGRGRGTGRTPGSSSLHLRARGKQCSGLSPAPPDRGGSLTAPHPSPCCRGVSSTASAWRPAQPGATCPRPAPRTCSNAPPSRTAPSLLLASLRPAPALPPRVLGRRAHAARWLHAPGAAQARLHPAVTAPGAPLPPPAAAAS